MNIEHLAPKDIFPYEKNAKKHDETQIKNVMESIKQFGFAQPLVIDKDNILIIGHCRLIAAKRLQLKSVPVVRMAELTPEQVKKLRLLDNKLNESEWDFDLLAEEVPILDFDGFDVDWGFEIQEDDGNETAAAQEDEIPEDSVLMLSKEGDLWLLGGHRLICGDSTDKKTIDILLDHQKVDLLLTDPPYGINVVSVDKKIGGDKPFGSKKGKVGYGEKGKNKILDCNEYMPIKGDETTETAKKSFDIAVTCTKNQIIFGGNYFTDFLKPSRCWVVWDKENTGNFADAELAWTSFDKGVKLYHFLWNGLCREGSREVEGKKRVHHTQKPVGMLEDILKDFSNEGESVLDMFGGSGSTLIACYQQKRKCYMVEYEKHYCDVIIQRYVNISKKPDDIKVIRNGQTLTYAEAIEQIEI